MAGPRENGTIAIAIVTRSAISRADAAKILVLGRACQQHAPLVLSDVACSPQQRVHKRWRGRTDGQMIQKSGK
jgi:hypothetical protein